MQVWSFSKRVAIAMTVAISIALGAVVSIVGPAHGATTSFRVDFTTPDGPLPTGFVRDAGAGYSTTRGYGWETQQGTPVDLAASTRRRTVDTYTRWVGLIVTKDLASNAEARWQRSVSNGTWRVTVGVGDPEYTTQSRHTIRVEGRTILDRWQPTTTVWRKEVTADVVVADGRLTIDAIGGQTTKLSWVEATLVVSVPASPPARIGWMYKPPTDGSTADSLASRYDAFTLTGGDEKFRDALLAAGAPPPRLYFRSEAIQDPGSPTAQPYRNQAANRPGDFAMIVRDHPDWFLRDAAGIPLRADRATDNYYVMDPGNAGWRAFLLQRLKETYANGWRGGVLLDNVELNRKKRDRVGELPAKYTTDAAYTAAIEGNLKNLSETWARPAGVPLAASMIEPNYDEADLVQRARYSQWLTGMQIECFATTWRSGSWLPTDRWLLDLRRVEEAQARGDSVTLFSQGDRTDSQRQQFAFASYLLVVEPNTTFRYHLTTTHYTEDWWYANYDSKLGTPKGARYQYGSVWKRDFTNGSVTVDPVTHVGTIRLTTTV